MSINDEDFDLKPHGLPHVYDPILNAKEILLMSLESAVHIEIMHIKQFGGVTQYQLDSCVGFWDRPSGMDEAILYPIKKKTAVNFAQFAEHLAIMAFVPGGVTFAYLHFEETTAQEDPS